MLTSLLSPLRLGIVYAVVLALVWRRMPRWSRAVALAPLIAGVLLTTPWFANLLVGWQEARAPSPSNCAEPRPQTIVVLGGGVSTRPRDADDTGALTAQSLRRLLVAVDLFHDTPEARLVVAGGVVHFSGSDVSEAELLGSLARRLGVAPTDIRRETDSRTTWQNARRVAALEPAIDRRIWLVTSAVHMSRAAYAFGEAGFDVCAWPADSLSARGSGVAYLLPATSALVKSDAALHEMVGELAYRWGFLRDVERHPGSPTGER